MKDHEYRVAVTWIDSSGTKEYRSYTRDHVIACKGKPPIAASSDPLFRGDASRYNPEELLVAALSSCHMLWYLHLCATHGVTVISYSDVAAGTVHFEPDGSGRFTHAALRPLVTIDEASDPAVAKALHEEAHAKCFIARSANFPVTVEPVVTGEP